MMRAMRQSKNEVKRLTVREVSEKFDVPTSSVRVWCWQGRFPNARQEETPRGPVWYIPESDLEGFEKRRVGRPAKKGGKK